jgi:quercetin dioxygenase-like cupin family protein
MYMLEGRIRVTGDGPEVTLEKGELIYFPIGCCHKVEVETEEAKFIVLYTPPRESSDEAVNAG